MARFTVSERNQYLTDATQAGARTTGPQLAASRIEADRHLPCVSPAVGTMFIMGSDSDRHFDMTLLQEGQAGGLVINGAETGYQLIPIITGSGIGQTTSPAGMFIPPDDFDGSPEVFLGSGATENMLGLDYSGNWKLVSSCKPSPDQNNREVEIDLAVFDDQGVPIRIVGFTSSANQASNGRVFTISTPSVTVNSNTVQAGEFVGLVVRKFLGEGDTTVRFSKGFVQIDLRTLDQS